MTPSQLSSQLNRDPESVCRMLYPNGKREGQEWVVGNTDGGAGDSLKIRLTGEKSGVWSDFATGESGGDFLDLWQTARGISLSAAMQEAAGYLGVQLDGRNSQPRKDYRKPGKPADYRRIDPDGPVMTYLLSRGLTATTLTAFRIAEQTGRIKFPRLENNPATILFPFLRDGELVNCKYLALARPGGKKQTLQEGGCEPCLFGWQAIPENARHVVLCEGEIDAMTWYQHGIPALSVPMGGGAGAKQDWIESDYDRLQRFDTLYISMDMDGPGQDAAKEIISRLGIERCRVVALPSKDANQCLMDGHTDFAGFLRSARTADPDELRPAHTYLGAVLHEFFPAPDTPQGVATPWEKVGDRLLFRPSEVTVWAGYNGHGKSLVLNQVCGASLAAGERWCIASMEMPAPRTLWRLMRQLTAQEKPTADYVTHCMNWLADKLWLFDLLGSAKIDRMLEVFAYAAKRYSIKNFIIDSLAKCGLAEDDYNGQKALIERIKDFTHQHQAHIHLVHHARKGSDENTPPGKMDIKGTGAITDMVDNVITVWRNKPKEAKAADAQAQGIPLEDAWEQRADASLLVSKQRHTGWEGEIRLWFDAPSLQYLESNNHHRRPYVSYSSPVTR